MFAGVVGSHWPALMVSLGLSEREVEEVKEEEDDNPLKMLTMWARKEEATYGKLYQILKTISLFQHKQ